MVINYYISLMMIYGKSIPEHTLGIRISLIGNNKVTR
jgi:hypothetical protein